MGLPHFGHAGEASGIDPAERSGSDFGAIGVAALVAISTRSLHIAVVISLYVQFSSNNRKSSGVFPSCNLPLAPASNVGAGGTALLSILVKILRRHVGNQRGESGGSELLQPMSFGCQAQPGLGEIGAMRTDSQLVRKTRISRRWRAAPVRRQTWSCRRCAADWAPLPRRSSRPCRHRKRSRTTRAPMRAASSPKMPGATPLMVYSRSGTVSASSTAV